MTVEIREATADDWPAIWPFFHEIVTARETYTYDPDLTEEQARELWMSPSSSPLARTTVAVDADGTVLGSANMYPNRPGPGSHVASASFMVDRKARGRGVGRLLCEDMIAWAGRSGFRSIQFNAVVETNEPAVRLWQSLGFRIAGTVPGAFDHPTLGYVGLHVMYRPLP
ncbi:MULTISPECIES: GNAT family N-acetyltransferase [Kribbella]|jgi:L-amino acid N-acyltransferase YncA|uniref:L-amino acid N-acyltransferase YncA n=1 Tax=Kribbella pratensis TaxID=2512112 RepID=A0ABY2FDP2_9ACTN|nr:MULTISPECIES: GNAT family N-acetyltransferase [Kribbella]TDW80969.1 L-amino acid N-acyltransferase YncA [Kribbella sp. VKM Ac-2566]TDW89480.1 L-amino acid N-acyltransferase YncA [Kribbella pratensis]